MSIHAIKPWPEYDKRDVQQTNSRKGCQNVRYMKGQKCPFQCEEEKGKQKQADYHSLTKSYQATNEIDVQSNLLLGDTGRGTKQARPRLGHKREVTCVNRRASKVKD